MEETLQAYLMFCVGLVVIGSTCWYYKSASKLSKKHPAVPAPRPDKHHQVTAANASKASTNGNRDAPKSSPAGPADLLRKIVVAADREQERMMQKKNQPSRTISKKTKLTTPPVIRGQK
jgi:hypothetical protein